MLAEYLLNYCLFCSDGKFKLPLRQHFFGIINVSILFSNGLFLQMSDVVESDILPWWFP